MTIHVALCADENFSLPMGVCITSILENNKDQDVHLHIITPGFSKSTIEKISRTIERYQQSIEIYNIDDDFFSTYPLSTTFPKSIYFRYLLPSILDVSIEKVIYVDSDTIILKKLSQLYDVDLGNKAIAAVPDANTDDIIERNRIGIYDGYYLNSGVLLINLDYWRKNDTFNLLTNFIEKYPEKCLWPDQDALNVVLHDSIKWLPFEYNMQMVFLQSPNSYRMCNKVQTKVVEAYPNVCIFHFSSWDKPWFKESKLPLAFVWRHYHKLSQWSSIGLKSRGIKYLIKQKLGLTRNEIIKFNQNFIPTMRCLEQLYL